MSNILLVVSGGDGEIHLDEVGNSDDHQNQMGRDTSERDHLLSLQSMVGSLRRSVEELKMMLQEEQSERKHEYRVMQTNIG